MSPEDCTRITYRYERWRCVCAGLVEAGATTFFLLLAVRYFHTGALAKSLVAGGGSVGLLLSPWMVHLTQRVGGPITHAASRVLKLGAVAALVAAFAPRSAVALYTTGCVLALTASSAVIPLLTQMYQDNYPAPRRGQLYASTFRLRIAAALGFGFVGGHWLEPGPWCREHLPAVAAWLNGWPDRFRALPLIFALALAVAGWALSQVPSGPLRGTTGSHPLASFRFLRHDRWFRQALIAWMLMGFANLAMLPMRVEYLGNPRYGLGKTAAEIALLTLVLPNAARLVMSPVWGWLFDRMNFFVLRIALNLGFALGIAAFFTNDSWAGLLVSALVYGIANAGGDVAWGLWVTKFAPPDHVADYMTVHTFLTGVRGVLAPLAAFQLIQHVTPSTMGWLAGGLIVIACFVLVPEIWSWIPRSRGERSVEPAEE